MKQGWEIKTIGNVCKVIAGQSPEGKYYNTEGKGLPFYQGKKEYGVKYIGEPTTWTTVITKEAESNDILMSVRAPVGPINFATQKICIGRGLAAIRATKLIDKEFLFNFLLKHENEIVGNAGAVFNSINKAQIEAIEIPLPPLSEQKVIVSILNETFSAIEKAKANAEQNLKNAKELFESYLETLFANKNNAWDEEKIGEIIETNVIGLTKNTTEQRSDYKYKYVKMNNITRDNRFDFSKFTRVNANPQEVTKYSLVQGDFLFNTRNSYELVGKTCLFEGYDNEVLLYNNNIMRIRFSKSINSYFINYSFTTKNIIEKLNNLKSGTTNVSAIYYKDLKNLTILIPPIQEQHTIVKKLDVLLKETKKLEVIYQKKIKDLEEFKKSVLQKAFNGELNTTKAIRI